MWNMLSFSIKSLNDFSEALEERHGFIVKSDIKLDNACVYVCLSSVRT